MGGQGKLKKKILCFPYMQYKIQLFLQYMKTKYSTTQYLLNFFCSFIIVGRVLYQ